MGRRRAPDSDSEVILLHRPSLLVRDRELIEEGQRRCIPSPFLMVLACFPVVLRVHGARELQERNDPFSVVHSMPSGLRSAKDSAIDASSPSDFGTMAASDSFMVESLSRAWSWSKVRLSSSDSGGTVREDSKKFACCKMDCAYVGAKRRYACLNHLSSAKKFRSIRMVSREVSRCCSLEMAAGNLHLEFLVSDPLQ